jgi:uncharacterized 2Fe-2S/4Fe-4S cluster protein (DUF4445 family)
VLFEGPELEAGWRLACRLRPRSDLTLELAQWEAPILGDDSVLRFDPREGLGVAVDLGTTTLVAQLVDLSTAGVLGVRSALNAQARHGADLMSRLDFAGREEGAEVLRRMIREQIGELLEGLIADAAVGREQVREVILAGNSVMHHLFGGLPVEGLSRHPFEPSDPGPLVFPPSALAWDRVLGGDSARVLFLPCLGGFVGSDLLAGILATRMHESAEPMALIDLGTNGEIVVGNRERLLCASTAAGPAFEGAKIGMGMRASTGAISEVRVEEGGLVCRVVGGGAARGICGSGLVDAVACGLELGRIQKSGRLAGGTPLRLTPTVEISQRDIRELQLAKGAIAAGLHILSRRWGTRVEALATVHLAGAFGNYINRSSARHIGLLPFSPERVRPAGNTSLLGAKLVLFREGGDDEARYLSLRRRVEHVSLNDDPEFMDTYVAEMAFPAAPGGG